MNPFNKKTNQVSIFITAGYPEQDSLTNQITELERSGVDFIEVGIPFSDPMADGPVIQHSSAVALKNGMSISLMFFPNRSYSYRSSASYYELLKSYHAFRHWTPSF